MGTYDDEEKISNISISRTKFNFDDDEGEVDDE